MIATIRVQPQIRAIGAAVHPTTLPFVSIAAAEIGMDHASDAGDRAKFPLSLKGEGTQVVEGHSRTKLCYSPLRE
jgi:hypothetical protein